MSSEATPAAHPKTWSTHSLYVRCTWICHRVVWYLQNRRIRLEYDWKELWISVLGLLSFLAGKFDTLLTTGRVGQLIANLAIAGADAFLPTPQSVHELVYELVRNSGPLARHKEVLDTLGDSPDSTGNEALRYILDVTLFYNEKIGSTGAKEASDALRIIVQEVELNGLHCPKLTVEREPP
ncbi:hypothetical protein EST38_g1841 [Candolleomyces aberdarensis]|uniref:Armadillo-like helical domain-containing protein n=1 Tax=Candolleomyces aberdarensis TaxID=2316362 RepID=A0A4Q2DV25_9AGAR|nr:hypothetical protein EST38_g1841 [Candolleomyces aberdarensis]